MPNDKPKYLNFKGLTQYNTLLRDLYKVVNIVNSYEELQNYDITSLLVGDKIIVTADENIVESGIECLPVTVYEFNGLNNESGENSWNFYADLSSDYGYSKEQIDDLLNNLDDKIDKEIQDRGQAIQGEAALRESGDEALDNKFTTIINGLNLGTVGESGYYIKTVSQVDGQISATKQQFDTSIPTSNPSSTNAPTSSAVADYVDTYGGKIDTASINGSNLTIDANKNLEIPAVRFDINNQGLNDTQKGNAKKNLDLDNVVNTGDSATPVESGETKFTTGGAYNLKQTLQGNITTVDNKLNQDVHIKSNSSEFDYNGDIVTKTSNFKNLNTGDTSQVEEVIQLANETTAGLMSYSDYNQIRSNTNRIAALEGTPVRLIYTTSDNPTAAQIKTFVDNYLAGKGITNPTDSDYNSVSVKISGTNHIWNYYANNQSYKDDGLDTVTTFTNSIAGIIQGTNDDTNHTKDGKVYAENDGTGSVLGWGRLTGRVNNLETGTVTNVQYDTTNKKLTKTINGQTTDVVTASKLKEDMSLNNVTNDKQIKGLSSGAIENHFLAFDTDGYTVKDSGYTGDSFQPKFTSANATVATESGEVVKIKTTVDQVGGALQTGSNEIALGTAAKKTATDTIADSSTASNNKVPTEAAVRTELDKKANKNSTVTNVSYDDTNNQIIQTINGTNSPVLTITKLKQELGLSADVGYIELTQTELEYRQLTDDEHLDARLAETKKTYCIMAVKFQIPSSESATYNYYFKSGNGTYDYEINFTEPSISTSSYNGQSNLSQDIITLNTSTGVNKGKLTIRSKGLRLYSLESADQTFIRNLSYKKNNNNVYCLYYTKRDQYGADVETMLVSSETINNAHKINSGKKSDGSTDILSSTASKGDITLGDSGVSTGSYGNSSNQTPGYGETFKVPYITVNSKGIVTAAENKTVKIPASDNTNQKVKADSVTFGADDVVDIVAGSNVTVTGDATNKKITISSSYNNYYQTPIYSSGLKISTGTGLNGLYVPTGTDGSTVALGNHTHSASLTSGGSSPTALSANTTYTLSMGGKSVVFKTPDDTNTTYTFATGDSNGQIKVTPSGGSAQNISVKGLGSAAYTDSSAYCSNNDSRLSDARPPLFANSTWYIVGDDCYIGDHDVAGTFCIKGANGTPGIYLYNNDNTFYASVVHSANIGSQSVNYANTAGSVAWTNVSDKPSTFPPSNHNHQILTALAGNITSANIEHYYTDYRAHMRFDVITSTMTTAKPNTDGYLLSFNWNSSSQWNTQIAIPNGNGSGDNYGKPLIRYYNNSEWTEWATLSLPASDVYAWAKESTKPTYTASEVGALKNYGNDNSRPNGSTFVFPGGTNPVSARSGATSGNDIGIFYLSDDNAFVCNSSDNGYTFAVFDTDKTADFGSADNAAFVVLSDHTGVKSKGLLSTEVACVNPTSQGSYNEGIRINKASNGWANITLGGNSGSSEGTGSGVWLLGRRGSTGSASGGAGDFTIEHNGSTGSGLTLYADGSRPRWNTNPLAYTSDIPSGSSLWNAGSTTWNVSNNVTCSGTGEWSFDCDGSSSSNMWHVWSSRNSATILGCYPYDNHVEIPNGYLQVNNNVSAKNLSIINNSSNTTYDAMVYLQNRSNEDWAQKIDCTGYNYGLNIICADNAANALNVNGNTNISNGSLVLNKNSVTTTLGSQNSSYFHFETTTSKFYFNKTIEVDGAIKNYSTGYGINSDGSGNFASVSVASKMTMQYNSNEDCIDFVFN